jgi:hypothetical protein
VRCRPLIGNRLQFDRGVTAVRRFVAGERINYLFWFFCLRSSAKRVLLAHARSRSFVGKSASHASDNKRYIEHYRNATICEMFRRRFAHGEHVVSRLPDAKLFHLPSESHLAGLGRGEEILRNMIEV